MAGFSVLFANFVGKIIISYHTMKKIIASIICAVTVMCFSLPSMAQFRYGPTASVDLSTLKFKQDLFTVDQSVGFSAGVAAEMMFPGVGFGLDMGLRYQQRGATLHLGEREIWSSQGYGVNRCYLHQIDIPFHLKFKYTRLGGFETTLAPFVYAGPTFSFTAGHNKIDALKYAGGEVGVEFGVGAEIKQHWQVSFSYDWGVTYALKTVQLTDLSAKQSTFDLRLTYLF